MRTELVRPKFDDVTGYSYAWAEDAKTILEKVSQVRDIGGSTVKKQELHDAIREDDPLIVAHYNHGAEDAWMGSETERIMTPEDVDLLSGRIAYTMNCSSAKTLGVEAWKKNCKVYVGYADVFAFTAEDQALFRQAVSYGLYVFVVENVSDWTTIKKRMIEKFDEMIQQTASYWTQVWLTHDRDALRIYDGESPPTGCGFRNAALKLFGARIGWKLRWAHFVSALGLGIAGHDYVHHVWELRGTVFSLEGGYVGFLLVLASWYWMIRKSGNHRSSR